ncbi:MAG: PEP/pyruvate-binding domain-containing protein [Opitutaceae bacterium]|nr:PEP/pyruvate-binding domain-containing protein [Opitutaceae bacterium]
MQSAPLTTGLPRLDAVMHGISAGDNIVWMIDEWTEYRALVQPYVAAARAAARPLHYFRFGPDEALVEAGASVAVHHVDPAAGFGPFVRAVHRVIEAAGPGAHYLFDNLSHLAEAWISDLALGNFFRLTCPRLWQLETVTYFAVRRARHSDRGIGPILQTTQFMLDIVRVDERLYIRPIKVPHHADESMDTIHEWRGADFIPVRESAMIAQILSRIRWPRLQDDRQGGHWQRLFDEVDLLLREEQSGRPHPTLRAELLARVRRAFAVHRSGIAPLVERHLGLDDFVAVRRRMIGIGSVGGKTLGMLVSRAVLRDRAPDLAARLEVHDSFFVGAETFVSFLVENDVWWIREKQRREETFLQDLDEGRRRILQGEFPAYVLQQFESMLDYFGEAPYIVRSSSVLEDARGNAFSGKYDSIFVVNRGSREERLEALLDAVRTVYASVLGEEALLYRKRRGLLLSEERMALLIMRVSGAAHGRYFFPQAAGVGLSCNPYVWHPDIDPRAGVVRLVFGLGTRAVDRSDDDYTRLVALNALHRRPETSFEEACDHAQRRMDCLDLATGQLTALPLHEVLRERRADLPVDLYCTEADNGHPWVTFDGLLRDTPVPADLRRMLAVLEEAFGAPVDTEFALNFLPDGSYRIHLLQCRTFQFRRELGELSARDDADAPARRTLLSAGGAVIGVSREQRLSRVIYIVQAAYAVLPVQARYEVARIIGRLCRRHDEADGGLLLVGPGRWGTSSPSLGIPVSFAEINHASAICEIVAMHDGLIPDVSLGTHFFNDLVEYDTLYVAYFPRKTGNHIDSDWFENAPNRLCAEEPEAAPFAEVIRVIDCPAASVPVWLRADAAAQLAEVFTLHPRQGI